MNYSFNGKIAEVYGLNEAVFIHSIYWWTSKNEADGRNYHDGRNWTFYTTQSLLERFPFWTKSQIERIVSKLRNEGAVLVENYNKSAYDRTRWYALSDFVKSIYENDEMDLPKTGNGDYENKKSISEKQEMEVRETGNGFTGNSTTIPGSTPVITPVSTPVITPVELYGAADTATAEVVVSKMENRIKPENPAKTETPDPIYSEVIAYLNEKAGTAYKSSTGETRGLIRARQSEGFSLEDFKTVIRVKCKEWGVSPPPGGRDMRQFLRPGTLFGEKFEAYLNQQSAGKSGRNASFGGLNSSIDMDELQHFVTYGGSARQPGEGEKTR